MLSFCSCNNAALTCATFPDMHCCIHTLQTLALHHWVQLLQLCAPYAEAYDATRGLGQCLMVPSFLQVGKRQWERVLDMVAKIRSLDMEVCTTLGMLTPEQAHQLRTAGLTAYNHNLDTSPEYYPKVTSSRKYQVCSYCSLIFNCNQELLYAIHKRIQLSI